MKKIGAVIVGILIFISFLIMLGPRVVIDPKIKKVELPDDIDSFIKNAESIYKDITPGAEKRIIWYGSPNTKTEHAVVFIHGFGATRQELSPVPEKLAAALEGNYYGARLKGHGRPGEYMGTATVNDWLNDAVQAIEVGRKIGNKVTVIGNSTGCSSLSYLIGLPEFQDLHTAVLISPNYGPKNKLAEVSLFPWALQIAHAVEGETRTWEPMNEMQAKYWTTTQPTRAVLPMMGLVHLARNTDHENVTVPALFIYSPSDEVVDPLLIEENAAKFSNSRVGIHTIAESSDTTNHILAGDIIAPENNDEVFQTVLDFVKADK